MSSREKLEQYTNEVEAVIGRFLPAKEGYQSTVLEAMDYSVNAGGKRLRPLFMREVYRLFAKGRGEAAVEPFMAAIEMIHTFSLVHDDLPCMDNDTLRRGKDTTWVKYGYDMAVLAGDGLAIYAFETAAKAFAVSGSPETVGRCIGLLAEKSGVSGMIGGQTADVELTGKAVNGDQLDFIYRLKTGALLEASMMIGALLGGANKEQVKAVEKMASCVGTAFQIQDDILDLVGDSQVIGKHILSDEKNEKTTYVTLYGMEAARAAVMELSREAQEILERLPGDHEFLAYLIDILITREK